MWEVAYNLIAFFAGLGIMKAYSYSKENFARRNARWFWASTISRKVYIYEAAEKVLFPAPHEWVRV